MPSAPADALGLIAGQGSFPLIVARQARRRGRAVVSVAFHEHTDPRIEADSSGVTWLHPGEVAAGIAALRGAGVRDAVMAGKIPKAALIARPNALRLDGEARALLAGVATRADAALLSALALHLESRGIHLIEQTRLVPELLAGVGPLGRVVPDTACRADIAHGVPIALALAQLDVGQTLVVKDRAVVAVEAIDGTDATILRGGRLARGSSVIKVAGGRADPRFDLPAVGPETVRVARRAGVAAIAFEAGRTVVLERDVAIAAADAAGIALVGVEVGVREGVSG